MSHRFQSAIDPTDLPIRQTVARIGQPVIDYLIVGLFAGGTAICTALITPILWAAVTDAVQQSRLTYQQCGAVKEETGRLACYDSVLRQNSLHSAKEVHTRADPSLMTH